MMAVLNDCELNISSSHLASYNMHD